MVLGVIGVTGASGMLGKHIATALGRAGYRVRSVGRAQLNEVGQLDLSEWHEDAALDEAFNGAAAIVHAGALVPSKRAPTVDMYNVNVRACANLGRWALSRSVPLVFVSSASVYANPDTPGLSEDAPLGLNELGEFYGMSKLMAEDTLVRYRNAGLRLAVVRPSVLYGHGGDPSKMPYRFLFSASRGETLTLTQPVEDSMDFIHAWDCATAIIRIIETGSWHTFNIASGSPTSVSDLAIACIDAAGRGEISLSGPSNDSNVPLTRYSLDTSQARRLLNWQPAIDVRTGLGMVLAGQLEYKAA